MHIVVHRDFMHNQENNTICNKKAINVGRRMSKLHRRVFVRRQGTCESKIRSLNGFLSLYYYIHVCIYTKLLNSYIWYKEDKEIED